MTYKLIKCADPTKVGTTFEAIEVGNVLTFMDGTAFVIEDIYASKDNKTLIAVSNSSQLTFELE